MNRTLKIQNRGWETVNIPMTPNFIRRVSDNFPIPVEELSTAQLHQIGKKWTAELIAKAVAKRTKGSGGSDV